MKLINSMIMILLCTEIMAQSITMSSIDSGGDLATSGDIEMLYTIGEVNVQELSVSDIQLSEGFISIGLAQNTLGIEDLPVLVGILVYPNPTTNSIVIKGLVEKSKITIYDINGRTVLDRNFKVEDQSINIEHLSWGGYILKIFNLSGMSIKKVIKH